MIDTIVLRLHDLLKYENLIKNLDRLNTQGYQTETGKVDSGEILELRKQGVTKPRQIVDCLRMNHSGEFLIKQKRAKHLIASSHYSISYQVDHLKDFAEFNLSVPKYIFGSNVLQFVEHFGDPGYTFHECVNLDYNLERSFELLQGFLQWFFKTEFSGSPVDQRDVEIHRIDVCYNQVFPSMKDALCYLEYQKRLKKKYARNEEGVMRDYATSLMYVTKRYSAKIYHKGSEYKRNDLKEHLAFNKKRGYDYFDTDKYQAFSDKILRYELTLRTDMLNYLHKRHLFRRKCPAFQPSYQQYLIVENKKQRNDRIAKKIGTLPEEEKAAYRKAHPYEKIDGEERKVHRWVSKVVTQRTFFRLAVGEEAKLYNKLTVNYDCKDALFSRGLLKLCFGKLQEFIGEFQIKELPAEDKVSKLIEAYNLSHRKPLPTGEMVWFYKNLVEIGSFKDTAKFFNLHRATMYRYKERFKKLGITENNILPVTEEGLPKAPIDFRAYHHEITYTPGYLKQNNSITL